MKRKLLGIAAATGMSLLAFSGVASAQAYPPQGDVGAGGAQQSGAGAGLALTGSDSSDLALAGVAAVGAGGVLTVMARRRRLAHSAH